MADKVIYLREKPASAADERNYKIKYAELLNPAQLEAVTHRDGPLLVVAGAGSGKTRTLIYRVARLIESGVPPAAILLLTFTRRASQEMLRRAEQLVGDRAGAVAGGTFHSFANNVLRRHGAPISLKPNFTILDRSDMEDVVNLIRTRMGLGTRERRFPKKAAVAEAISMARNKRRALPEEIELDFPHLLEHLTEILKLAAAYESYKRERGLLDYDDLLYRLAELLDKFEHVRRRLSDTYRYIMIDEYQDTNLIQAELVRLLAMTHRNVMAVGDDAQSIYSFRGANFRNIMDFPAIFPGAKIVKLEENYRSLQGILDLANDVIARAGAKYAKALFTGRRGDFRPFLVRAQDEHMQSRFVAQRILELREEGVELAEIAVLFRSGFHSFDLELELQRRDIPFIKRGGFKFIETAHIKDVLAHLRIIVNPQDAVSWLRALTLVKGIGHRSAERAIDSLISDDNPEAAIAKLAARARGGSESGLKRLATLIEGLRREGQRPADQIAMTLEYYLPVMREAYADDHPRRERDLEHFQNITERYKSLERMLADMALEPPSDSLGGVLAVESEDEYLTLSTIHSAKGLEWKVVFLIWAAEGRFPAPQSVGDDDIEEERRLMYVASTRARDELYLSYPIYMFDRAMGYVMGRVSRFLEDVPAELLQTATLQESEDPD
ncbi:MAG: ATP-dependent helicase [Candidatus Binatus sp.]|uniref:ATP-dependent helicase n=1 Tax=Candidatus Binatus sp. TaxID=2811406 RepID=UPI0027228F08|nr:ATP-dependent helicase [Candidatus Binatus sp.]MDO8431961.1 ATP-dependent helicase [Candidatus Binatus sp.]